MRRRAIVPLLLAALTPLLARGAPTPVLFNADDDNRDGIRDFEAAPFESDDEPIRLDTSRGPHVLAVDAPLGKARLVVDGVAYAPDDEPVEAAQGSDARVEATAPRSPNWDGRFRVTATDADGGVTRSEYRVAPLLVRPSTATAKTAFVREFPGRNDRLIEQLREATRAAGAALHVVPAGEPYAYNHIWLQDCVEFCAASAGGRSLTIALAANRNRAVDLFARDRLLGPAIGWLRVGAYRERFARGEGGVSWIDWYGNLEASPPTPAWPAGRVLYGVDEASGAQLHPTVVAFFAAQGAQSPVAVDVGWLTIRHVDETVAFLPTRDGAFVVAVPDPTAAIGVLRRLAADGHGATPLLDVFEEGVTVEAILADEEFLRTNERLWTDRIEPMSRSLLEAIGVDASRLVRLPVLFQPGGLPRTPNVVNCLVLPADAPRRGVVAMADPNGPVVGGEDAFQAEVRRRLVGVGAEIRFVDDRQYHRWSGNVHCATNALRTP